MRWCLALLLVAFVSVASAQAQSAPAAAAMSPPTAEAESLKAELQAERAKNDQQQLQITQLQQAVNQLQQEKPKLTREQILQQAFDGYFAIYKDAYERIAKACGAVKKGHASVTVDADGKPRTTSCAW